MSQDATRWALSKRLQAVPKVVLLVLAGRANLERQCWPSLTCLAADTGLNERTVRNGLAVLIAAGLLQRQVKGCQGTLYTLRMTLENGSNVEPAPTLQASEHTQNVEPAPTLPPLNVERHDTNVGPGSVNVGPGPTKEEEKKESKTLPSVASRARAEARGCRLPDGWQPSPVDSAFASQLGLDPAAVAERFADYWRARPGADARKLDWSATWRNWCRKDATDRPQVRAGPRRETAAEARRRAFGPSPYLDLDEPDDASQSLFPVIAHDLARH